MAKKSAIDYKKQFYTISEPGSASRQLASKMFRAYKDRPGEAYNLLTRMTKEQHEQLLKYIDKPYIEKRVVDFVSFYVLYRVTLQDPRLKQVAMQNNLALLYTDLDPTSKEGRLKAVRRINRRQPTTQDVQTPETIVQTPETIVETPKTVVETPTKETKTLETITEKYYEMILAKGKNLYKLGFMKLNRHK